MKKSIWDEFTNLYSLSKTLRFELRPIGKTAELMKRNQVFEKDKTIDDAYRQAKFYFDKLHQQFIKESLKNINLDFSEYEKLFLEKRKLQKQKSDLKKSEGESEESFKKRKKKFDKPITDKNKEIDSEMDKLRAEIAGGKINREEIIGKFNETGPEWKKEYLQKFWDAYTEKYKNIINRHNLEDLFENLKQKSINEVKSIRDILQEKQKNNNELKDFLKQIKQKKKKQKHNEKNETNDDFDFSKADLGQNGYNFILSAGVLKILKYKFPKEKDRKFQDKGYPSLFIKKNEDPQNQVYIFNKFDGFTGYLNKFQETRKNMYSEKSDGTAISNRIINENLQRFLENKLHFEELEKENICFSEEVEVDLNKKKLSDIFSLEFYNQCLLQDDINFYNRVIGGETKELKNGEKQSFKGLNQIINEYKQQHKNNKNFKKSKFSLFKALDKQILGEVEKEKQLIELNENGKDNLFERLKEFINENEQKRVEAKSLFENFVKGEYNEDKDKIYLSSKAINTISRKWFQDSYAFEILLPQKSKKKYEKDAVKLKDFISLSEIKKVLDEEIKSKDIYKKDYKDCIDEQKTNFENFIAIWNREFQNLFEDEFNKVGKITRIGYKTALIKIRKLSENFDRKNPENIEIIKNYADASLRIFQMMKYFALEKGKKKNPENLETGDFYVEFEKYYNDYQLIKYYNAFRNFLTKKPYSENKIKLNFEKGNLLDGFTESKTNNSNAGTQYGAYLFRNKNKFGDYDYFLGISKDQYLISKFDTDDNSEITEYERLNYYQMKTDSVYGASYAGNYQEDKEKLSKKEIIQKLEKALAGYQDKIPQIKNEILEKEFNSLGDIRNTISEVVKKYGKLFEYKAVTKAQWDNALNCEKGFYLFQIYNKDFSREKNKENKDKNENLHTMYFKRLMLQGDKNVKIDKKFDLGSGEIFLRKASIKKDKDIVTKKNKKNISKYIEKKYNKNIKHINRYSDNKIIFHLSTTWNYGKGKQTNKQFNQETNQKLFKQIDKINIIGIDRGEKHLAYYSVINQNEEIIDQGSFNKINGHDYHKKLDEKEKERMEARKSWKSIGNIKELKEGYISQVVRKIADLIIEHNAIVVFEDLNFGFKRGRQKIEKQIYQKLEKALIEKLSFLVSKDEKNPEQAGHILNAYQFTAPLTTLKGIKQTGVIFYTTAGYTSTTDPLTGWRKNIYISNSLPIDKPKKGNGKYIKGEIQKFRNIAWDEKKRSYFFEYIPKDFGKSEISEPQKIYANVARLKGIKNDLGYWETKFINPNDLLKDLFQKFNFELKEDIKKQIEEKEKSGELTENKEFDGEKRSFYKSLIYCLNLILQIRNSSSAKWVENKKGEIEKVGKEADFIQSPIYPFFSTKCKDFNVKENLAGFEEKIISNEKNRILNEFNGDANGAYNIARKGILLLSKIRKHAKADREFKRYPDLFISNSEWDKFAQSSITSTQ